MQAVSQQRPLLWALAPQPDVVRAAQKDDLYLDHVLECIQDAVMRTMGPILALQYARECRLVSSAIYYLLTTGTGLQTLGEEYCDIVQMGGRPPTLPRPLRTTPAGAAPPGSSSTGAGGQQQLSQAPLATAAAAAAASSWSAPLVFDARGPVAPAARVALALLQSAGPYVAERLAAALGRAGGVGGWDSGEGGLGLGGGLPVSTGGGGSWGWTGRSAGGDESDSDSDSDGSDGGSTPSRSAEDGSEGRCTASCWQQLQQLLPHHPSSAQQRRRWRRRGQGEGSSTAWQRVRGALAQRWPQIWEWGGFGLRAHLALFYLYGTYYHWEKRLLGVTYTSTSPFTERRTSYQALGWMLVAQLAVSAAMQALPQLQQIKQAASAITPGLEGLPALNGQHAVLLPDSTTAVPGSSSGSSAAAAAAREERPAGAARLGGGLTIGAGKQCPLCLSPRSNPACTPCGHVFCWDCVAQWCNEKPECPLCRASVISPQLVCLYHSDF